MSPLARDFVLQCFQKDHNLRVSARKLLKHPWMLEAVKAKQSSDDSRETRTSTPGRKISGTAGQRVGRAGVRGPTTSWEHTLVQVQEWNQARAGMAQFFRLVSASE